MCKKGVRILWLFLAVAVVAISPHRTISSSLQPNNSKSSKTCRKKEVDNGHPQWSLALATQKPKALSQLSEPRGWRRWSREALFNNHKMH